MTRESITVGNILRVGKEIMRRQGREKREKGRGKRLGEREMGEALV